jgi:hypothetical protein
MPSQFREYSIKGKTVKVPVHTIDGLTIIVTGKFLKIARIHEEEWFEPPAFSNLDAFLRSLKMAAPEADLFVFSQGLSEPEAKHTYPYEWDDVAAVPITTFPEWWEALPQESRKNVRKGEKRGVIAKTAVFDDAFVAGIKSIYDETPIRQGRNFWHYGKDVETIKRENSSFSDRSEFIAAYFENELIGFIKMVYVGKVGRIMQILSKNSHIDKKPPNILLSKAVETCALKGMSHFIYGKYFYGNKGHTPITEFKRRNGFVRLQFPQYFIPLSLTGKLARSLNLHQGIQNALPHRLTNFLLDVRARLNRSKSAPKNETGPEKKPESA